MALMDIIKARYSCRAYLDKAVEQDKLDQILEAARLAPSAKNTQDWRFVVVTDAQARKEIASCTNKPDVFEKAGVIIAACSNSGDVMRCGQAIGPIDISIALEHIALQATELGLGSCWIGAFDTDKVRQLLEVPQGVAIIELMVIGYPDQGGKKGTERLPIEKIVCYQKWEF